MQQEPINNLKTKIMKLELTHEFKTPTEHRNDILFSLKSSGIFHRTIMFPNEKTPSTPAVEVNQSFNGSAPSYIVIPLDRVDKFCEEIKSFAGEMNRLMDCYNNNK